MGTVMTIRFDTFARGRFSSSRRAAAAVEMALVLPLFLAIVFGIVEFGRALMVNQVLVNAAREGARHAVTPGASDTQVLSIVDSYMTAAGITGPTRTIMVNGSAASLTTANPDDTISVLVSVPHSQVSFGIIDAISGSRVFAAEVKMRKE